MPDYNLAGLSSGSFEQLIQAIASKFIGPGSVIFGAGPDGAREATFEGKMDYPSVADPWTGYLVIQAKFLQRPLGSAKDGAWALSQLEAELKKFTNAKRKLRLPEYYIFCTNVVLSAVHKSGARDRVEELFKKYSKQMPLKGYGIWDYDKIRSFIDGAEDIRRAYSAWITSGDILRRMMEWLQGVQLDFHEVIGSFLQNDLLDDRYARLDQAGHTTKELTQMASLFVDLPFSRAPESEPPDESKDRNFPHGFLRTLLAAGAQKLDPSSLSMLPQPDLPEKERTYGRYVLIGGPGQGKTTVGQFACQLYRAAILDDRANLAPEVRDAVNGIKQHCANVKVEPPRGRRFPVRIVLNELARKLADNAVSSLLEYLLMIIKSRSGRDISTGAFQKWLSLYPWFLVLDGLDEVPPSSNRDQVIQAVTNFLVFANDAGADLMVLATTRPQGYNSDFSPKYYRHRYLTPLSDRRAIYYGERLANVTHGDNTTMARDVIAGLKAALESPTTARLMRSPLQVTIMATLVARGGPAPQERWVLFRRYYTVIYDRETAKRLGDVTELLRSYKTHIDAIHHRVGLTLQIESERSGQTDARLSTSELSRIVSERLTEEGLSNVVATQLQKRIIDAASDRLVFLVGVREGQIAFEIRSLQEFMAAEALMDGADADAIERLNCIAPVAHWNNVFLFTAGTCFADRQHLRPTIVDICTTLNESTADDEVRHYALVGSQLALLLLQDGLARQQWTHEQALARNACRLRFRFPVELSYRLASAYHPDLRVVFEEEVMLVPTHKGAVALVVALADRGVDWAISLAEGSLSKSVESYLTNRYLLMLPYRFGPWQRKAIMRLLPALGPMATNGMHYASEVPSWIRAMNTERIAVRIRNNNGTPTRVHFALGGIAPPKDALPPEIVSAHRWAPVVAAIRFRSDLTCDNLAAAIRTCQLIEPEELGFFLYSYAPWPLAAVMYLRERNRDWEELATLAQAGAFGTSSDWRRAEERWASLGAKRQDIEMFDRNGLVPGPWLKESGFPFTVAEVDSRQHGVEDKNSVLFEIWRGELSAASRSFFAQRICGDDSLCPVIEGLEAAEFAKLLDDASTYPGFVDLGVFSGASARLLDQEVALNAMDHFCQTARYFGRPPKVEPELVTSLFRAWLRDNSKVGLLSLCASLQMIGVNAPLPTASITWEHFRDTPAEKIMTVLKILNGEISSAQVAEVATRVEHILAENDADLSWRHLLFTHIRRSKCERRVLEKLITELYHRISSHSSELEGLIISTMDDLIGSRRSGLDDPNVRGRLKLPLNLSTVG